jgi:Glucodextranase, domain B
MLKRLVVCAACMAALVAVPSASAAVTASNVSAPADGAGFDFDEASPGTITVSGTATAADPTTDKVDLVCTYAGGRLDLAGSVALNPTGANTGTFTADVNAGNIDYYTCLVRAVPAGTNPADLTPFTGPVVHGYGHQLYPVDAGHPNDLYDYYQDVSAPLGYWDGYSASGCFVSSTYTLDPATLGYAGLFGCANVGAAGGDASQTHAAVQLDGRDAYLPATAFNITPTGFVPITDFARSVNAATGDASLSGSEHLMSCANGSTAFPATSATCPSWNDAGVTDRASTIGDHGGRLVRHTDTWSNPGSAPVRLDVWYAVSAGGAWLRFPGETDYAQHADGDHTGSGGSIPTPPAGAASVLLASDPNQADYANPRGSLTWSGPPAEILFAQGGAMFLHYQRTIPAGGTAPITLALATDGPQANVDALSAAARGAMPTPSVAFASPADGATVNTSTVTVTGTATGDGPLSVNVNAHPASVAGNGAWSVAVPLQLGANTLTATVADADGNSAHASRTVRYAAPSSPPPAKPSNRFSFTVKKLKRGAKSITVIVKLPGPGKVRAKLTAAGKTLARASKAAKAKGHLTVKLRLTRKALALIRKRHKVKAKLSVTFTPTGGTARTTSKRLTLRR